ncbi:damage-inducible protein J [Pasteurellaceae bacterium RH1A]|nr:damage-inducible protein J [Pasteurellaceae bacterium RH1A]
MQQNALVSVRINEQIKAQASEVLAGIGLTLSDVMRMTITKIATEKRFSFDYQPNAETAQILSAVKNGTEPMHTAASIQALMDDLTADD